MHKGGQIYMQSCYKIWSDLRLTETPGAWQPHGSRWLRGGVSIESFSKSNCWTMRRILGLTSPSLRRKPVPWGAFRTAEGPQ